eukprot:TRINITY_DN7970_c0_g1_i2.p1 TRINITY_DN7970_c0_g1~~TRINITY_DN7970_c0_g1_i2.p1  ORF type:complete len:787 (+),score=142.08 TRINITY_DN7970_c0_g1_i2:357-2717(+)
MSLPFDGSPARLVQHPSRQTLVKLRKSKARGTQQSGGSGKLSYFEDLHFLRTTRADSTLCLGDRGTVLEHQSSNVTVWRLNLFHEDIPEEDMKVVRGGTVMGMHNKFLDALVGVPTDGKNMEQQQAGNADYNACLVRGALGDDDFVINPAGARMVSTVSHSWMLWQVEHLDKFSGKALHLNQPFRLRHYATQKYLAAVHTGDSLFKIEKGPATDPALTGDVWKPVAKQPFVSSRELVVVDSGQDGLPPSNSVFRFCHPHETADSESEVLLNHSPYFIKLSGDSNPGVNELQLSSSHAAEGDGNLSCSMSQFCKPSEAITPTKTNESFMDNLYVVIKGLQLVLNSSPRLYNTTEDLLAQIKRMHTMVLPRLIQMFELPEVPRFADLEKLRKCQLMMRRMQVIDPLAAIAFELQHDERLMPPSKTTLMVGSQIQQLLQKFLQERENAQYLLKHLSLLIDLLGSDTGVTATIRLLVNSNTVSTITRSQIDRFMYYLRVKQLPHYVSVVAQFCVVDGTICRRNQSVVLKILQTQDFKSLTPLLQLIDGDLCLWWAKRAKWVSLKLNKSPQTQETLAVQFCASMMDLLASLCQGDHVMARGFVQKLFKVQDLMTVLNSSRYDNSMKATVCQLVCHGFMPPNQTTTPSHLQRLFPHTSLTERNLVTLNTPKEQDAERMRLIAGTRLLLRDADDPKILENIMKAIHSDAAVKLFVDVEIMKDLAAVVLASQGSAKSAGLTDDELDLEEEEDHYRFLAAVLDMVWKLVQSDEYKTIGDLSHLSLIHISEPTRPY